MSSIATGSNAETVVEQVAAVLPNHTKYVTYTRHYTVTVLVAVVTRIVVVLAGVEVVLVLQ